MCTHVHACEPVPACTHTKNVIPKSLSEAHFVTLSIELFSPLVVSTFLSCLCVCVCARTLVYTGMKSAHARALMWKPRWLAGVCPPPALCGLPGCSLQLEVCQQCAHPPHLPARPGSECPILPPQALSSGIIGTYIPLLTP